MKALRHEGEGALGGQDCCASLPFGLPLAGCLPSVGLRDFERINRIGGLGLVERLGVERLWLRMGRGRVTARSRHSLGGALR
jgi:hypothetical protein